MSIEDKVTQAFYDKWAKRAVIVHPHQIPPTRAEMMEILSILDDDQIEMILHQFDDDGKRFLFRHLSKE